MSACPSSNHHHRWMACIVIVHPLIPSASHLHSHLTPAIHPTNPPCQSCVLRGHHSSGECAASSRHPPAQAYRPSLHRRQVRRSYCSGAFFTLPASDTKSRETKSTGHFRMPASFHDRWYCLPLEQLSGQVKQVSESQVLERSGRCMDSCCTG
jgi:hypothetical protein